MNNRRESNRSKVQIKVTRQSGFENQLLESFDISPTGIKLKKPCDTNEVTPICNLKLHFESENQTTTIAGRTIWENNDYETFEFISPSFAQQILLERLTGNL